MKVETILAEKGDRVVTITENERVSAAIELLNSNNIGALVVVRNGGEVCGILSERDVVRRMSPDCATLWQSPVSSCMTPNPYTCTPDSSIHELMQMMTDKRIRHMPVLVGNRLAGLISIGDIVKRKIEQTEQEAAALREYIAS